SGVRGPAPSASEGSCIRSARRLDAKGEDSEVVRFLAVRRVEFVGDGDSQRVEAGRQARRDMELNVEEIVLARRQAAVRPGGALQLHVRRAAALDAVGLAELQRARQG